MTMVIHKKIIFSVVSLACGVVMWQAMRNTCPPREQHLQAVTDVVQRTVDRIFEERVQIPEESRQLAEYLSSTVIPQAVEKLTRQKIDVRDFGVFSLGQVSTSDGDSTPVSLGIFGKVFTFSEDDAYDYISSLTNEKDIENILQTLNNNSYGNKNTQTNEGQ